MPLVTHNITGSLKDADGNPLTIGTVTFVPYATHDARVDGSNALLGPIVRDIKTLPDPVVITAGNWTITIATKAKIDGRDAFKTITTAVDISADTTWGSIVGGAVASPEVTPTHVQQAQAAADEAEMWAGTAQAIQDTQVETLVNDDTTPSATRTAVDNALAEEAGQAGSPFRVAEDGHIAADVADTATPIGEAVWKVGPTEVNVRNYGVDPTNTAAANDTALASLFTDHTAGVRVAFPDTATYEFSAPLPERSYVGLVGAGYKATLLRWTAGSMLAPTTTLHGWSWTDLGMECTGSASHLIDFGSLGGLVHSTFDRCDMHPRVASASIVRMAGGTNFFGIRWRDCLLWRDPTDTVSAIDITTPGSGVNSLTFENTQLHAQNHDAGTPFIRLESTASSAFVANIVLRNIIGEQNLSGILHGYGVNGVHIEDVIEYDASTYSSSLFYFAPGSGGADAYGVEIDNSGTAGPVSFTGSAAHLKIEGLGRNHRIGRVFNGPSAEPVLSYTATGVQRWHPGGWANPLVALGASQGLARAHHTALVTQGSVTTSLPATAPPGREYVVKNATAANSTTVNVTGGGTIDGATSVTLSAGAWARFVSDGTTWYRIG